MRFKPGSIPWLVAFDLRLGMRGLAGRMRVGYVRMLITFGIVWLLFAHLFAWAIVTLIRTVGSQLTQAQDYLIMSLVLALIFLTTLGVGLNLCINLIFARGDLDMLCTSPLPVQNIFTARSLSIAVQTLALPTFFLLPIANVELLYGRVKWLALYPVTLALGLVATACAIVLTLSLIRSIGLRRARTVTLILGALLGVSWILVLELPSMLGHVAETRWKQAVIHWLKTAQIAQVDSVLWYPARAAQGDLWPLLVVMAVSGLIFLFVTFNLQRVFLLATQCAAGMTTRNRIQDNRANFNPRFWRVMFLKEWRMVYRSPQLLIQIFTQLIFLVPAAYLLFSNNGQLHGDYVVAAIGAALVAMAGMLASTLVWVAVCAEDAPEFLATSPRLSDSLRTTKMLVMLAPLWAVMLIAVIVVGMTSVPTAFWMVMAIPGITLSLGVYHLWMPAPGARTQMWRARRAGGGMQFDRQLPLMGILFGWAGMAFCMPTGHWLGGLIAVVLALIAPVFVWWRSRSAEQVLAY